ncbi:tetratricopeptide repeat protein [Streptomyces sp. NBC_01478]|uniref:tetratricopeptide repeat protein n=1 Tax=Streptomyces sp. NBC_01478 TaxID=2903882 RepID=UPI002E3155F4|nr:tetratricopeptide repeat protein [Streptomyces sp. NBC_01478]
MNTRLWHSGPEASAPEPADVSVSCHRRLRGPYTGAGSLMRALVPSVYDRRPDLVDRHAIEILSVAPELQDRIGAGPQTLTSLAIPEEQTRIYAAVRTRRLAHGLVELLVAYARLSTPGVLRLAFTDADEADHTDQEFLAILLRRTQGTPVAVAVGSRGGELTDELAAALDRYARPVEVPAPGPRPARDQDRLLHDYIDADGASDDPDELAAYRAADPDTRARLHDERAERLRRDGDRSLRLGAIPYHLEHGGDPAAAAGDALYEAVYHCAGMGFWHAILDYAPRARTLVGPGRAELYAHVTGKMSSALAFLGRTAEAERCYLEVRGRYTLPLTQIFTGYALSMLYTRLHPPERRDHAVAKAYVNNSVTLATLLPDPELRTFHTVFQLNGLALVEMHMGNLEESFRLVDDGLRRMERELPADRHRLHRSALLHNRARVHGALGRPTEALADFTAVIALDPNYPDYYFDRADVLQKLGDDAAALADYGTAITLGPPFWELHYNRADLRARSGDTEGAIADLARVVELEPDQLDARVNLIGLLLENDAVEAALPVLEEGLRLDPGDARLLQLRGQLAWEAGRRDAARRDFDLALDADPGCVPALAGRATLLFEDGEPVAALRDLTRAIEVSPDDPDLRHNRAHVHQATGDWKAAADDYTHALTLPGADLPELLRQRARCHRQLGNPTAAETDLNDARAASGPAVAVGAA